MKIIINNTDKILLFFGSFAPFQIVYRIIPSRIYPCNIVIRATQFNINPTTGTNRFILPPTQKKDLAKLQKLAKLLMDTGATALNFPVSAALGHAVQEGQDGCVAEKSS